MSPPVAGDGITGGGITADGITDDGRGGGDGSPHSLPSLNQAMIFCAGSVKGVAVSASRLVNRNVIAGSGRTSMRLEPELWEALLEVCQREDRDVHALIRAVDASRHAGGRTSAVRVFLLQYYRVAATESGHAAAGHGPHVARRAA